MIRHPTNNSLTEEIKYLHILSPDFIHLVLDWILRPSSFLSIRVCDWDYRSLMVDLLALFWGSKWNKSFQNLEGFSKSSLFQSSNTKLFVERYCFTKFSKEKAFEEEMIPMIPWWEGDGSFGLLEKLSINLPSLTIGRTIVEINEKINLMVIRKGWISKYLIVYSMIRLILDQASKRIKSI